MRLNVPFVGFVIGLVLPWLGLFIVYKFWGTHEGMFNYVSSQTYKSKSMTMALLINILPFVYCNVKRLDYAMRGIVVATMLYALFILLVMFVW